MDFNQLKDNRQRFWLEDPLWAISTDPGTEKNRWELDRFFQVGRDTVAASPQPVPALSLGSPMGRGTEENRWAGDYVRSFLYLVGKA